MTRCLRQRNLKSTDVRYGHSLGSYSHGGLYGGTSYVKIKAMIS